MGTKKTNKQDILNNIYPLLRRDLFSTTYMSLEDDDFEALASDIYDCILIQILYDMEQLNQKGYLYPLQSFIQDKIYEYGTDYLIDNQNIRIITYHEFFDCINLKKKMPTDIDLFKTYYRNNDIDEFEYQNNTIPSLRQFEPKTHETLYFHEKDGWYIKSFNLPFLYNFTLKHTKDIPSLKSLNAYNKFCADMLDIDLDKFSRSDKLLYLAQINSTLRPFEAHDLFDLKKKILFNYYGFELELTSKVESDISHTILSLFNIVNDIGLPFKSFVNLSSKIDLFQMYVFLQCLFKNIVLRREYFDVVYSSFYDDSASFACNRDKILSELESYYILETLNKTDNKKPVPLDDFFPHKDFFLNLIEHTTKCNNYFFCVL